MKVTEQKFRDLLDKYLSGRASSEEEAMLNEWFDQYKTEALGDPFEIPKHVKDELAARIHRRMQLPLQRDFSYRTWLAVAASVAFFITVSIVFTLRKAKEDVKKKSSEPEIAMIERVSLKGQKLLVRLPDSTLVKLNSESKLRFPERFEGQTREVSLEGEGYFDVTSKPQMPFIVTTGSVKTTVLGTSFNVKAIAGSVTEITLVHGKVNVLSWQGKSDSSAVILQPNQQAIVNLNTSKIIKQDVEVDKFIGWKNNILHFENTSLTDAIKALESWYGLEIELEDPKLGACIINAKYQNETFENVLQSLHFLLGLDYEQRGDKIILKGNGCKAGIIIN